MSTFGSGTFGSGTFGDPGGTGAPPSTGAPAFNVVAGAVALLDGGAFAAQVIDRSDLVPAIYMKQGRTNSPGQISVQVGNAKPFQVVWFFFDGEATAAADMSVQTDENGALNNVYLPIMGMVAGDHVVRVSANRFVPPAEDYDLARAYFVIESSRDAGVVVLPPAVVPPMPDEVDRWVFQAYDFSDVTSVTTYVLPINPSQVQRSFGSVEITHEPTTVSNGKIVSWEGMVAPPRWSIAGAILTEAQYRAMISWGQTGQRFYVTDNMGFRFLVKVTAFGVQRVRDVNRPWHHRYTMTMDVLSGTGAF